MQQIRNWERIHQAPAEEHQEGPSILEQTKSKEDIKVESRTFDTGIHRKSSSSRLDIEVRQSYLRRHRGESRLESVGQNGEKGPEFELKAQVQEVEEDSE